MKIADIIVLIIFAIVCAIITVEVLAFNLAMLNPSNFPCFMAMAVVLLVDIGYVLVMTAAIWMLKDLWNIIQNNDH